MKCWRSSYTTKSPNEEGDWDGHWTCAASFGFCHEAGGFIARVWMRCAMIIPGYIRHENSIYLFEGVVPTRLPKSKVYTGLCRGKRSVRRFDLGV